MIYWHPTTTPKTQGWFPLFNATCEWLVHGAGQCYLSRPATNEEHYIHQGWHVGWIGPTTCLWFTEEGEPGMYATEVPALTTVRRADLDWLIPGLGDCRDGHWGAVDSRQPWVAYDTRDITPMVMAVIGTPGVAPYRAAISGDYLLTWRNDTYDGLVFEPNGGGYNKTVPAIGSGSMRPGPRGEVLRDNAGHLYDEDGRDISVTPWFGDGAGLLLDVEGVTWHWEWVWHDRLEVQGNPEGGGANTDPETGKPMGGGATILHPLGDPTCLYVPSVMCYGTASYYAGKFYCAGTTDKGYLTVAVVDAAAARAPAPDLIPFPTPKARVTFDPLTGRVPLIVTGRVDEMAHVETWRWCRNGQIDQPIDGLTHTYPALNEWGTYAHNLRAAGPGGRLETVPVAVEALPHVWRDAFGGLQAGFGGLLGDATMGYLRDFQFERVRVGLTPDASMTEATKTTLLQSFADEARGFGLEPLVMIAANEALCVPEWSDVEIYAPTPDYSHAGTEPDLRADVTVDAFARAIMDAMPALRARHCRVWTGCVSNPSVNGRSFLSRLFGHALMPADVHLTFHRYSPPRSRDNTPAWTPFATRLAEIDAIKAIAGPTRRIAVTEWGYHTAPQPVFGGSIGSWLARVWPAVFAYQFTDEQVADFYLDDWALYWIAGLTFVCPYQINDGETADALGRFGIRRYPSEAQDWKPSARTVARFARPARVVWGA